MDPTQRTYLATQIHSEQATISYRTVARALKVHVNAAKRILYEFHAHENGKKPNSVHATYLLAGIKKVHEYPAATNGNVNGADVDDEPMPSSPPPFTSSMLQSSQQEGDDQQSQNETVPVKTITLVREESLEALKGQYESISSIHIYSLSPYRLQDIQTLTDIGRDLFNTVFIKEDPLLHNKTYGVIQNSNVKRRTGKRPPISEASALKFKPVKDETRQNTTTATTSKTSNLPPTLKKEDSSRPSSAGSMTSTSSTKQPTLKRDTSDIFKSFAKARPKPKDEKKDTDASTNGDSPAQSGPEDVKMTDADEEGESEDEALFLDTNTRKPAKKRTSEEGDLKKDKDERAAKLRKMMDSDDESEKIPAKTNVKKEEASDKEAEDADVAWSESDSEKPKALKQDKTYVKEELEAVSTEPTRRRRRRKVMKKRTMKDEEGYLVTKEEAVWESFSEDEPASQPKPKAAFPTKTQSQPKNSSGTGKASGKAAGKGGNIMSFFGKK